MPRWPRNWEPPHIRGQPLPPHWMSRAGFIENTSDEVEDHRGQLYEPPQSCQQCIDRAKQCFVIALRPAPIKGLFYCSSCSSCNGSRKCSLASRMDDWAWRWNALLSRFVPERLPQHILDRRARNREGSSLQAASHNDDNDGGEDDSSDEDITVDSDTSDGIQYTPSHEPTPGRAIREPPQESAPRMSTRSRAQHQATANPAPRQANEARSGNGPAPIVIKHEPADRTHVPADELWGSDHDDDVISADAPTMTSRLKRARNASAGPSKRTRTSTEAPNPSATLAFGPVPPPTSPSAATDAASTHRDEVEGLKADLERVKVERDSALEERDALLELYRNSVQRTRRE